MCLHRQFWIKVVSIWSAPPAAHEQRAGRAGLPEDLRSALSAPKFREHRVADDLLYRWHQGDAYVISHFG